MNAYAAGAIIQAREVSWMFQVFKGWVRLMKRLQA